MPNKVERFTNDARIVLYSAEAITECLGLQAIAPVTILLACLSHTSPDDQSLGSAAVQASGLELGHALKAAYEADEFIRHPVPRPPQAVDLSPGTKRLLELAVDEARRNQHYLISSLHLLVGLMRLEDETTDAVMRSAGINTEQFKAALLEQLADAIDEQRNIEKKTFNKALHYAQLYDRIAEVLPDLPGDKTTFLNKTVRRPYMSQDAIDALPRELQLIFEAAFQRAFAWHHQQILPFHLLAGIFGLPESYPGRKLLAHMNLDAVAYYDYVQGEQAELIYEGDYAVTLTGKALAGIAGAQTLAKEWQQPKPNGAHLLLWLLDERDTTAEKFLEAHGFHYQKVRRYAHPFLSGLPDPNPPNEGRGFLSRLFGG